MDRGIHDTDGAVLRTPSPEYLARVKELERFLPVMTKMEQDQLIYLERTDWPEETLIKWSGKLAERNAAFVTRAREAEARSRKNCK
ncbi:MAG: hypothetical protein IJK73_01210 [Bacteroidales bacterium]|nr:hypothetical protein [Bacteroidales bacterium]